MKLQAKFVRIGKLDNYNVQHVWAGNNVETYHKAPVHRGFYACPWQLQESFLVSSLPDTQPQLFAKNHTEENVAAGMKRNRHYFVLDDKDLIWSHLDKSENIQRRSHTWVLTTVRDWRIAVNKAIGILVKGHAENLDGNHYIPGSLSHFSKDDFEVFISKETKV